MKAQISRRTLLSAGPLALTACRKAEGSISASRTLRIGRGLSPYSVSSLARSIPRHRRTCSKW